MTVHAARLCLGSTGGSRIRSRRWSPAVAEVCLLPLQAAAKLRQSTPKSRLFTFELQYPVRRFILKRLRSEWQTLSREGLAVL